MPKFHLINSALGGMGKSLLSQVMIHLHDDLALSYAAFDADVELLNVQERYPETTSALKISESEFRNTDAVYRSMEAGRHIIINLAASSTVALEQWFQRDRLFLVSRKLAARKDGFRYQFVNWFLSDGTPGSISKFQESVATYGDQMFHVFVQNWAKRAPDDWSRTFQDNRLRTLLEQDYITTAEFPCFLKPYGWDEMRLTFAQAISPNGLEGEALPLLDRQRVASFVRGTQQNLQLTGLIDCPDIRVASDQAVSLSRQAINYLLNHE
ncbi:hypothetical protein ACQ4M3_13430 [Leptolyngbya sp. AN03gr2]|uniref:hypothetical protein n=1 Tax=unclassified Leptolyngbya TaxID=2650499 RepID=UPI003D31E8E4